MLRSARRRRTLVALTALCAAAATLVTFTVVYLAGLGGGGSVSAGGSQPLPYGAVSPGPRGVLTPSSQPATVSTVSASAGTEPSSAPALRPARGPARPIAPERWAYLVVGGGPHQLVAADLATGTPHPMGPGDAPTPSPDRTLVAFVAPDPAAGVPVVRVAGAGGAGPHTVSDPGTQAAGYCLAWSPAGGLAFTASARGKADYDIYLAGPKGVVRLTSGAHVTGCSPETRAMAWSPDGHRLAFVSDLGSAQAEVEVADASTGAVHPATRVSDGGFGSPSWLPGGTGLLAQRSDDKLVVIDPATGQVRRVTSGNDDERAPALSPDGVWVAYLRSGALALVRLSGAGGRALTPAGGMSPAPSWSADGTTLVFTRRAGGANYSAFTRVAAGSPAVVIHRGSDYYAAW